MNTIMVSIICNAFNQEEYIERALLSFISQQTTFKYEILIHDDASTDRTAEIIRGFEKKYPELIKPIYQTENQYSKKISITSKFQLPRAQGKYVAFCEGDDYWIDNLKLQRQFDALEQHKNINICGCGAYKEIDGAIKRKVFPLKQDIIFSVEQVIINDGDFFATASLMCRKQIFANEWSFYKFYPIDYAIQMMGALHDGVLYIGIPMAVYRTKSKGSWTMRVAGRQEKMVSHLQRMVQLLNSVQNDLPEQYNGVLEFQKNVYMFETAKAAGNYIELRKRKKMLCSLKWLKYYRYYIPQKKGRKFLKFHCPIIIWKIFSGKKTM